ncbi:MAG: VCBS repeat-containing protein [gamma proteobacterium symbiont of Bathyaustriella thionipta]|nr:VCBS repeat-containing protein [gamma proteobacterium symbiont of Bathyaustriella thionipta]
MSKLRNIRFKWLIPIAIGFSSSIFAGLQSTPLATSNDQPTVVNDLTGKVILERKLLASDAASNDELGNAVAISGDTVVIGAPDESHGGIQFHQGAAYVYVRNGNNWVQQAKLIASGGNIEDNFGTSVAIEGNTILVGAPNDDFKGFDSGAVYVFTRIVGSSWMQRTKIVAFDGIGGDQFGNAVALSGSTALIGAYRAQGNFNSSGAAYVFTGSGSSWSQQARLTASDGASQDEFGAALALYGNTLLIGARGDDDNGQSSGSAYIFTRSNSSWSQRIKLQPSDGKINDQFGTSVSLVDGRAMIGAPGGDQGSLNRGSAYIYGGFGSSWLLQAKLKSLESSLSSQFGRSVSLSDSMALVGGQWQDNSFPRGAAYLFERNANSWSLQQKLLPVVHDGQTNTRFGKAVSISDVSGLETALAGAPEADGAANESGAAYAYIYVDEEPPASNDPMNNDFGADGKADILARKTASGQFWLYEMNHHVRSGSNAGGTSPTWEVSGIGDLGGDARADIVIRNTASGQLWLYEMDGSTRIKSNSITGLSLDWKVAGLGDLGGDGKADIVVRNQTSGQIWLYEMNGHIATGNNIGGLSLNWKIVGIGDLDGDAKADIIIRNITTGQLWLYQMDGHTITASNSIGGLSLDWEVSGIGDLGGDGKDDIVIRNTLTGQQFLYEMDGHIRTGSNIGGLGLAWEVVQISDLGGDGKDDIVIRNTTTGQLWLYEMDGNIRSSSNSIGGLALDWGVQP